MDARQRTLLLMVVTVPVSSLLGLARAMKETGAGTFVDVWTANLWGDLAFTAGTVAVGWAIARLMARLHPRHGRVSLVALAPVALVLHWAIYALMDADRQRLRPGWQRLLPLVQPEPLRGGLVLHVGLGLVRPRGDGGGQSRVGLVAPDTLESAHINVQGGSRGRPNGIDAPPGGRVKTPVPLGNGMAQGWSGNEKRVTKVPQPKHGGHRKPGGVVAPKPRPDAAKPRA